MKKTSIKIIILCIGLFIFSFFLIDNISVNAQTQSQKLLSQMTADECLDFIIQHDIDIPVGLDNSTGLKEFVKQTIDIVESEPEHVFVYNYNKTQKFAQEIKELVNNYYDVSINENISYLSSSITNYQLQYNYVYGNGEWSSSDGDWKEKWLGYNCYAYSINRSEKPNNYDTEFQYQPGDFAKTGDYYYYGIPIGDLAEIIKDDLEVIGLTNVTISDSIPTNLNSNQKLICVRTGSTDYHFMRFDPITNAWYHKPGNTAVLKYKYVPSNDLNWITEVSFESKEYYDGFIYGSSIKYIVYDIDTLELNCHTGEKIINKNISSGRDTIFEIIINCAKSYKFTSIASSAIEMTFYNDDMNTMTSIVPVMSNNSCTGTITTYLNPGTYYLSLNYKDKLANGNIETRYQATYPTPELYQVTLCDNDDLPTHLHKNEYNRYALKTYYINYDGPGFYKFTIVATKADGTQVTYPSEAILIRDHNDQSQECKYNVKGYSELAETDYCINNMYMYLPRNGYFYIHINLLEGELSNLNLTIEKANVEDVNVVSRYNQVFTEELFEKSNIEDFAMGFTIDQTSKFKLNVTTSGTYSQNITLVLFKKEYNSTTGNYYKTDITGDYLPVTNKIIILEEGTYYIGYFGNTSGITITATLERLLDLSGITTQVLVMDPDSSHTFGTEVRHNNGAYGENTITEGFTRHVHFQNVTGVPSVSRYDYNFYSSNENYATVSEFGTVFAKAVTGNKTVTIIAVYKYNPSIIFTKELTILDDTSNEEKIIETTQIFQLSDFINGLYQVVLDEANSAYPWFQFYNWSVFVPCQENDILVTMDLYGRITTTGAGYATLTGTYTINPNVTVIIHLSIRP